MQESRNKEHWELPATQGGSVCRINSFGTRYSLFCKSPGTPSIFPFQACKTMKGEGTIG
nr:MAG TPA: hypothetical protein [Caudoviricetes sp.]